MNQVRMEMKIHPMGTIKKDFKSNLHWFNAFALITMIYIILSSFIIQFFEDWTFLHSSYFTIINITSVGFGDIIPMSHIGKIIAGINSIIGLILFGILIVIITMALQPSNITDNQEENVNTNSSKAIMP